MKAIVLHLLAATVAGILAMAINMLPLLQKADGAIQFFVGYLLGGIAQVIAFYINVKLDRY